VDVNGHRSDIIKIRASAGTVNLTDCDGEMDIEASAGNIIINNDHIIYGGIRARSSAGKVSIQAAETGYLDLSSSAGSIYAKINKINSDIRLDSGVGSVTLEARNVTGNIQAKTSMGGMHLMLPDKNFKRVEASFNMSSMHNTLTDNEQSPYSIKVSSNMGSIKIEPI
jgi:DUF4097 and DUF4098 domain-containing protein YvlB